SDVCSSDLSPPLISAVAAVAILLPAMTAPVAAERPSNRASYEAEAELSTVAMISALETAFTETVASETMSLLVIDASTPNGFWWRRRRSDPRSEEHTSELQSRENLVC